MYEFMLKISRFMAVLGGLMLVALIFLTCASIIGRSLNGMFHSDFFQANLAGLSQWGLDIGIGPINGDYELIEAGVAFAIFAFMPLCQITGGHATVDVFTSGFSLRANRILRVITDAVFAAVFVLIAVQLYGGMLSKLRTGQTTFLIEFPVWWAYAPSLVGAVIAAAIAVYLAGMRLMESLTGRDLLPADLGADH
ncbi:MAG: TRAP transporter small permease [Rhodobacteraceae bacterium]|nr:TRAP transporter small permease [Paracoccaceae bacterium]PCJ96477.1 MAG: C4-dicarboxylate ABC transporter permease [Hyphomicrobiales bacterium]